MSVCKLSWGKELLSPGPGVDSAVSSSSDVGVKYLASSLTLEGPILRLGWS